MPFDFKIEEIIAQTEPLPFVSATWIHFKLSCGFPSNSSTLVTLSSPRLIRNFPLEVSSSFAFSYVYFIMIN